MKNNFQTVLLGIFLAFFVFGVLVFAGILPIGQKKSNTTTIVGNLTVWGTFDESLIRDVFDTLGNENKDLNIRYEQKDKNTYKNDLLQAFAKGEGPDLFLVSNNTIFENKSFIYEIPYSSYPKRLFNDSFINGASNIFLDETGVNALPIVADPLVLYYNKSILSNAGISVPPLYWDELFELNSKLTKKREDGRITQSMIALGTYGNITNAKDILSLLFMQNGNSVVERRGDQIFSDFGQKAGRPASVNSELMEFYTSFSNPLNSAYSWNKGISSSREFFTGNNLAFYIGRASELFEIQEINPNLSFDVTEVPQIRNEKNKTTFGEIHSVAINKNSKSLPSAFSTAYTLSSAPYVDLFSKGLSLPPALKSNLSDEPTDPYLYSFYKTAISIKTWLDPDNDATNDVFSRFVENVISGRTSVNDSIIRLQSEMDLLLGQQW